MNRPAKPDERELVERAVAGDAEAFRALYERHAPAVVSFLSRRVPPTAVDDLVAETFIAAWKHLGRFRWQRATILPWLLTIARRQLIASLRRRSSTEVAVDAVHFEQEATLGFEDALVDRLDTDGIRSVLKHLTPAQALVIELRYIDDLSVAETASVLSLDSGAVRARGHRALKSLRSRLATGA